MNRLGAMLLELVVVAMALSLAAWLVPGVNLASEAWLDLAWVSLVFMAVHQLVAPLLRAVTCLFYVLTLGLFHFVVNALLLWGTGYLAGPGFDVHGFWAALVGSLVISLATTTLDGLLGRTDHGQ